MPLQISKAAACDLAEAYQWYEHTRQGLGNDFILCIEEAFAMIQRTPEAFQTCENLPVRRYFIHRFPYAIFYVAASNTIKIEAVLHFKRTPSAWQIRIPH